uniref:NR LBD domain-containing protein n=1 Tax=Angiostrongylus cantonensis TaxID=6313 RepID=A0A0K0CTR6_ANGCA
MQERHGSIPFLPSAKLNLQNITTPPSELIDVCSSSYCNQKASVEINMASSPTVMIAMRSMSDSFFDLLVIDDIVKMKAK